MLYGSSSIGFAYIDAGHAFAWIYEQASVHPPGYEMSSVIPSDALSDAAGATHVLKNSATASDA